MGGRRPGRFGSWANHTGLLRLLRWLSLHELRLDPAAERIAHLHPRAVRNANSDSNADSDALNNTNCYANSDTYCYSYPNGDAYVDT